MAETRPVIPNPIVADVKQTDLIAPETGHLVRRWLRVSRCSESGLKAILSRQEQALCSWDFFIGA